MSGEPGSSSGQKGGNEAIPHPLPDTSFYSVEYPGYVAPTAVPAAIRNLGGQSSLDRTFKLNEHIMELKFRPDDPFSHPVCGEAASTSNLLLKITKRRKKRNVADSTAGNAMDVDPSPSLEHGEFVAEVIGSIPKTVRFRSMVDFQFSPDRDDRIVQLQSSLESLDARAIQSFRFMPEKEEYTVCEPKSSLTPELSYDPAAAPNAEGLYPRSNLKLLPPPLFSRQGIQQNYAYQSNNASVLQVTAKEGSVNQMRRFISKHRFKGLSADSLLFNDPVVPTEPSDFIKSTMASANPGILKRLKELFEERPVWTRLALLNQFSAQEAKEIHYTKTFIPLVAYIFNDGPWRDTLVRFGYDPRKDPEARVYQRLYFRNKDHPHSRAPITKAQNAQNANAQSSNAQSSSSNAQSSNAQTLENNLDDDVQMDPEQMFSQERDSHIFDGVRVFKHVGGWQLCDVHDPLLVEVINNTAGLRKKCTYQDGWYTKVFMERIKAILRLKQYALMEEKPVKDGVFTEILASDNPSRILNEIINSKPRTTRKNRAKKEPAPEEIAAVRLRRMIENQHE